MSDVTIKVSVDPDTGAVSVSSDEAAGPAPTVLPAASSTAALATGDAPAPSSEAMAGLQQADTDAGGSPPPPLDPALLGTEVEAAGMAIGEAGPAPEDFEVLDVASGVAAADDASLAPMPLATLEKEKAAADKKAKSKKK